MPRALELQGQCTRDRLCQKLLKRLRWRGRCLPASRRTSGRCESVPHSRPAAAGHSYGPQTVSVRHTNQLRRRRCPSLSPSAPVCVGSQDPALNSQRSCVLDIQTTAGNRRECEARFEHLAWRGSAIPAPSCCDNTRYWRARTRRVSAQLCRQIACDVLGGLDAAWREGVAARLRLPSLCSLHLPHQPAVCAGSHEHDVISIDRLIIDDFVFVKNLNIKLCSIAKLHRIAGRSVK